MTTKPFVCPICRGRGIVPASFYSTSDYNLYFYAAEVTCRTCGGTGIVWSPKDYQPSSSQKKQETMKPETTEPRIKIWFQGEEVEI